MSKRGPPGPPEIGLKSCGHESAGVRGQTHCAHSRIHRPLERADRTSAMRRQMLDIAALNDARRQAHNLGVNFASGDCRRSNRRSPRIGGMDAAGADGEKWMSARAWICVLAMMTTATPGA